MIKKLFITAGIGTLISIVALCAAAGLAGREIGTKGWALNLVKDGDHMRIRKGDASKLPVSATKTLPWTGGELLTIDLPVKVEYVQGPENTVTVTGAQSQIDAVRLEGGKLWMTDTPENQESINFVIGPDGIDAQSSHDGVSIVVTAPSINRFVVLGDGELAVHNYDQPKLDLELDGDGSFVASGRSEAVKVALSGSGNADLGDIHAKTAEVSVSGSGRTTIRASEKASVDISGSGNVELSAKPAAVVSHISGSGSLDQY